MFVEVSKNCYINEAIETPPLVANKTIFCQNNQLMQYIVSIPKILAIK